MKFTETQRKVLSAIIHFPGEPFAVLAKKVGVTQRTVSRIHDQFVETGLLDPFYYINYSRLGLRAYDVYFSLSSKEARKVIPLLRICPAVVWLAEKAGTPRYEVTFVFKDPIGIEHVLDEIAEKTGIMLQERRWVVLTGLYHFGKRFLGHRSKNPIYQSFEKPGEVIFRPDRVEMEILDRLTHVGEAPTVSQLGRAMKIPQSTIAYRVNQLRDLGILSPKLYTVRVETTGVIACQLLLSFRSSPNNLLMKLLNFCSEQYAVTTLIKCTGNWDYTIIVYAESLIEVSNVRDALEESFDNLLAKIEVIPSQRILSDKKRLAMHPELFK